MKGHKNIYIANFNCVFGENDEPMLSEFKRIVYPAFKLRSDKKENRTNFLFKDIKISNSKSFGYYLYGKIIKDTTLEIKSQLAQDGKLIEVDQVYETAPYSEFILYLKNHRMLFVPNQKGSPTIAQFKSLISSNMKKLIKANSFEENNKRLTFDLEIYEMPGITNLKRTLESTKEIKFFKFEVAPQNNDIFDNTDFENISKERRETGCRKITKSYDRPTNIERIKNMAIHLADMAKYAITLVNTEGITRKIENSHFKKRLEHYLPENNSNKKNIEIATNLALEDRRFSRVSKENQKVYNEKEEEIKNLQN